MSDRDTAIELHKETHKYYVYGVEQENSVKKYVEKKLFDPFNEKIFTYQNYLKKFNSYCDSNERSALAKSCSDATRAIGKAVRTLIENHLNAHNAVRSLYENQFNANNNRVMQNSREDIYSTDWCPQKFLNRVKQIKGFPDSIDKFFEKFWKSRNSFSVNMRSQ